MKRTKIRLMRGPDCGDILIPIAPDPIREDRLTGKPPAQLEAKHEIAGGAGRATVALGERVDEVQLPDLSAERQRVRRRPVAAQLIERPLHKHRHRPESGSAPCHSRFPRPLRV